MTTEVEKELLEATEKSANERLDLDVLGPACMSGYARFDWQASVPESVRRVWGDLPLSARLVAYICAQQAIYSDEPTDD